jgi:hypothetical protein
MKYPFSEGSVDVPPSLQDRTLHVLVPVGQGVGFTLVISRDELEPNETPADFLKRQLADLARQVTKYEEVERESMLLGDPKLEIKGVRLLLKYRQKGQFLHVLQGVFLMKDERTIVSITATASAPLDQNQRNAWLAIVASYQLPA